MFLSYINLNSLRLCVNFPNDLSLIIDSREFPLGTGTRKAQIIYLASY